MDNTISNRPLSPGMLDTLMEIHEREILGQDLCGQETRHIAGLYRRGMIDMKLCTYKDGKPYMGFIVTNTGREYLQTNSVSQKSVNTNSI
jgi:hypothetical protein